MNTIQKQIELQERLCCSLARSRNEAKRQQITLHHSDPNWWALADVIDSYEIRYAQAQAKLLDLAWRKDKHRNSES